MNCLRGIVLVSLVFELKFLNISMGREDPIEFDIRLIMRVIVYYF